MNKTTKFLYRNIISLGLLLIVIVTAVYAISTHNNPQPTMCGCATSHRGSDELPIRQNTPIQQMPSNPQPNESGQIQSGRPVQGDGSGGNPTNPCGDCRPSAGTVCPDIACAQAY